MDPRLVGMVVAAARNFHSDVVDVVSGFRHPKYNLMLRKKGHQVARDSQHTQGHAIDFYLPQVPIPHARRVGEGAALGRRRHLPRERLRPHGHRAHPLLVGRLMPIWAWDPRRRRRAARRGRDPRPRAAPPRDPAQLPDHRPLPLLARGDRPRAAAVHRHVERRGAAVLARSAALGLRVGEAARTTTSGSAPTTTSSAHGYILIQHSAFPLHVPHPGEPGYDPQYQLPAARARRRARPQARVPPDVDRQHVGDELRLAVGAPRSRRSTAASRSRARCRTPARAASRTTTATAAS